jgi:RNA polymerase sigma factor (sigma-70 family)
LDNESARKFERDIEQYRHLIVKVCRMYVFTEEDRQDLFQEIVLQAWKSYPRFKGQSAFSTYLYRIALNTAMAGLRRKKDFIRPYEPEKLPEQTDDNGSAEAEEQLRLMYKAIGQLNDIEKAIVMLYMEDKSYLEMEDILGITEGNLRVKMTRIKDKIRQLTKQ